MAKLTKYAKNGKSNELALIKNDKGKTASSPDEALTNLHDAHSKGSSPLVKKKISESIHNANLRIGAVKVESQKWNSIEHIRKAISTFGSKKAPGIDGITPEQMKLFSEELYIILQRLIDSMIALKLTTNKQGDL